MKKLFHELFIAPAWAVAYALVEFPSYKAVVLFVPLYVLYQYYFIKAVIREYKANR